MRISLLCELRYTSFFIFQRFQLFFVCFSLYTVLFKICSAPELCKSFFGITLSIFSPTQSHQSGTGTSSPHFKVCMQQTTPILPRMTLQTDKSKAHHGLQHDTFSVLLSMGHWTVGTSWSWTAVLLEFLKNKKHNSLQICSHLSSQPPQIRRGWWKSPWDQLQIVLISRTWKYPHPIQRFNSKQAILEEQSAWAGGIPSYLVNKPPPLSLYLTTLN